MKAVSQMEFLFLVCSNLGPVEKKKTNNNKIPKQTKKLVTETNNLKGKKRQKRKKILSLAFSF